MSVLTDTSPTNSPDIHESGEQITEAQPGSLNCIGCGFAVAPSAMDALPECPNCGGTRFRRASIFSQTTMDTDAIEAPKTAPIWLTEVREELEAPGQYLAFEGPDQEIQVVRLEEGWTRIGRSGSAEVRFDDATVSRRHALIVLTEEGELRAMDDRSLNGLFVNGERVEWAPLSDGDELEIGRYRLYVLDA
jgi:predicted RNA-binding Zn-ribbon protein involved in translation (DUF1610 family)